MQGKEVSWLSTAWSQLSAGKFTLFLLTNAILIQVSWAILKKMPTLKKQMLTAASLRMTKP